MEEETEIVNSPIRKLPLAAAFFALIGLGDSLYLTINHFTAAPVPCSLITGCETVLTSPYATIGDIPLAALGGVAYFIAFSLAILAAFGNRLMWTLFGIEVVLMSLFTLWLVYLQAFVIGAFCQFCLLSALTTFSMLVIFLISRMRRFR
jgi:uncharacterized membrane protein